jgi:hypothetical protein
VPGALSAAYSSDNQNDKSVEDQIELCRELCERDGHGLLSCTIAGAIEAAEIASNN